MRRSTIGRLYVNQARRMTYLPPGGTVPYSASSQGVSMPSASRENVAAWIKSLPEGAHEIRLKSGPNKDALQAIATVSLVDAGGPMAIAETILEKVQGAELGEKFRCHVHDKGGGKVLDTRYFSDGKESAVPTGVDALTAGGPILSIEDALWRICVSHSAMVDRCMTSNETLVRSLAEPITAMSGLFKNESERRESAETKVIEQMAELVELNALAGQAADRLEAGNTAPADPLRQAAADALGELFGKGKPTAPPAT